MKKRKCSKEGIENIIFIFLILILLILIFILSLKSNKENTSQFISFNPSEFENISSIGIYEYKASLNFDGTSIIFFCSNEEQDCYNELKELNKLAKKHNVIIEYINILELVDSEKTELINTSDIFKESLYPHLLIIENAEIVNNSNEYLNGNEIESLLKKHKIIN